MKNNKAKVVNIKKGNNTILTKVMLIGMVILIIILAITYYVQIPEISIYSSKTWIYGLLIIFIIAAILSGFNVKEKKLEIKTTLPGKIMFIILGVGIVVFLIGSLLSSSVFSASKYAEILPISDGEFEKDVVKKDTVDDIALMDTSSAEIVGQRVVGSLSDIVSQFEVSTEYSQIDLNGKPMKVAPLEYADFFKYLNNKSNGVPGYVMVDPITNEAEYIKLDKGMKYSTSSYFNSNLQRHLRFQYPTAIFEGYYFEVDEDGKPYYVCPILKANVGLFGAMDIKGIVICDPVNGESNYYSIGNVPDWVDRTYSGDLLCQKYNWYGTLSGGYINSLYGNKGCKVVTSDFSYKIMEEDMWIYTGVTSVNGDQSNIGFVIMNTRTSETRYYKISGAEEYSAMESAEGAVQHLEYVASFPSIVNINNQPTYVMVLKDNGGLVKMYAYVNMEKYNIVATGTTLKEALSAYKKMLFDNGIGDSEENIEESYDNKTITIDSIQYIPQGTETYAYIISTDDEAFKQNIEENETIVLLKSGDHIKVYYEKQENGINELVKYK